MSTSEAASFGHMNRRTFVRASTAVAALAALPRRVRSATSANEKLNIAAVGLGGQGAADLGAHGADNIVALCDVDAENAAHTFTQYPSARRYTDYRVLFDREKDIDAVIVATPDHLHASVTMTALKLGKHVYLSLIHI